MTKTENPTIDEMTYEQAFSELESVVAKLEDGSVSLDESVKLFERGQALASRCASLLENARLKVSTLEQSGQAGGKEGE
jgi:exodeoxyribonuclease VII small subunit